ncbi:MAG: fluoride efflux transporter CrcB [Psychrilyobacter sp.]|nr:fluoride efflux transporter CrcB [Psychrilyobacter sp.]
MILNIIFVAIGGSIGAICRYKIDKEINKKIKHHISFGTLGVNLVGLFIIGFSYSMFTHHFGSEHLKLFLVTGFLGALTTFSSYALHTFKLFEQGKVKYAIINILLNNFLGMFIALLGAELGKYI